MFIDALIDFYEQNSGRVLPAYHTERSTDYLLEIGEKGGFEGVTTSEIPVISPTSGRTSQTLAHLVFDKASYVLGIYHDEEKGRERLEAYQNRIRDATNEIDSKHLNALLDFLSNENEVKEAAKEAEKKGVTKDSWIAPLVGEEWLVARQEGEPSSLNRALHEMWLRAMSEEYLAGVGDCLACGESKPILRLHETISEFGSQSFVNMNKSAFRSHGLEQSTNAPMCLDCASKYVQSLEYLSKSDRHHLITRTVRDDRGRVQEQSRWLAWVRVDTPDFTFKFLNEPDPEDALDVIKGIWRSTTRDIRDNQFYAASLTFSDKRVSLRNFERANLDTIIERTKEYFDRQRLVRYGERQTYSLFSLLEAAAPLTTNQSTGRHEPDRERLPPRFADALVEHVLTGHALPKSLRDRALRRCRAEHATAPTSQDDRRRVDYAVPVHRAALLKLFLSSQPDEPMPTEKLDREHSDPAYHCGRYLAVADKVYYAESDGSLENYVSKRYYSSASTTPASVIGRIIPNVQHRLDKLRRERGGQATNLDKKITQIMGQIGDFPKTLQPNRQALFALGFYHQRDHEMTSSSDDDDA